MSVDGRTELESATRAMSQFLLGEASLGATLQWVVELALAATGAADGVGLTLLEGRTRPATVFASDDLGPRVDEAQYAEGDGPCLQAYRSGTVVYVADSTGAEGRRWPAYQRAALEQGVGSTLSLPLIAGGEVWGALNFYATRPRAFDDEVVERAGLFSAQASVLLANASAYWDARDLADNLTIAMRSRAVIEQAKGKLMASNGCTADEAFQMLVNASQRTNIRLREVAERIVRGSSRGGAAPKPAPPRPRSAVEG